jgi:aspartate aminotransferase
MSMMKLTARINTIKPSPTLAITMKANTLRAQGRDIIGFGAGEPDFDTPDSVKRAAIRAIEEGFTKYTPVGGIDELKDAIIGKLERDNGLIYNRAQIVVSCGAKHTLYNLAQVLFEEGDEVIIPSPYWVSYPDIVLLTGAKPVILETKASEGFKIDPAQLKAAVGERTKAVILNSPSNPSGVAYSAAEMKELAEILAEKEVLVISDDIYEKILYDGVSFANAPSVCPVMKDRTVVVNGLSKSHAMTGWRIGYAAGPADIIAAVTKLQSQNTSNPNSIAQKASVEALNGDQTVVHEMVGEFEKRRNIIVERLNAIPGVVCRVPQGAFYVFPSIAGLRGRKWGGKVLLTSADWAAYLLEEADVAVIPGGEFGHDDHLRLSYATSMANIEKGLDRISAAVLKSA